MSKEEKIITLKSLKESIRRHDKFYYVLSTPKISDKAYDMMVKEIEEIEKQYPDLATIDSPTQRVSNNLADGFKRVEHINKMLSLKNAYNEAELTTWYNNIIKKFPNARFICEIKYDGSSVKLIYENGLFTQALTRGTGVVGDDVTDNVRTIRNIPLSISTKERLEVVGEVLMSKDNFKKLNKTRETPFANCRSAANGSLKLLEPTEVSRRDLMIRIFGAANELDAEASQLELRKLGLPVDYENSVEGLYATTTNTSNIENIIAFYSYWQNHSKELPYDIDGVVVKVEQKSIQNELGEGSKYPNWAIAGKFDAETYQTKLKSITYQVGMYGSITPVAELEPVIIEGTEVKRATLNNANWIKEFGLYENDTIEIIKSGQIIPKCVGIVFEEREPDAKPIQFITECPSCGTPLKFRGKTEHYCDNDNCRDKNVAKLNHFAGRKAMDIDGFGRKSIEFLYDNNYVTDIIGLYLLAEDDELQTELQTEIGWGEKSVNTLVNSVIKSKEKPFETLLYSLGLYSIGNTLSKELVERYKSLDILVNVTFEDLAETYGEITCKNILKGISSIDDSLFKYLNENNFNIKTKAVKTDNILQDKKFVVSGTFEGYNREEMKKMVTNYGGVTQSGVNGKTDYLLAGAKVGASKLHKAEKLGTKIISFDDFMGMLDIL